MKRLLARMRRSEYPLIHWLAGAWNPRNWFQQCSICSFYGYDCGDSCEFKP